MALNCGKAPNYTEFEKALLAEYEGLLTAELLTQEKEIKLLAPIPILKPILTTLSGSTGNCSAVMDFVYTSLGDMRWAK